MTKKKELTNKPTTKEAQELLRNDMQEEIYKKAKEIEFLRTKMVEDFPVKIREYNNKWSISGDFTTPIGNTSPHVFMDKHKLCETCKQGVK